VLSTLTPQTTSVKGKTSLSRTIASKELPGFPQEILVEYIAASDDEEHLGGFSDDVSETLELKPIEYMNMRINQRSDQLSSRISELEAKIESNDADDAEEIANQLSELYELEEEMQENIQREMHAAIDELGLNRYTHCKLKQLSSGWRYKCRLATAFLIHPDLLIIDEPSFLDEESSEWIVKQIREAATRDKVIVLLISHKETLLDELCDSILYINSGNQTLSMYHCGYSTFRSTHQDIVDSAVKTISETESIQHNAEKSLKKLQTDLKSREKNLKARTAENSDKRFIKGKNKEAKQKADRCAASKLKQAQKKMDDLEEFRRNATLERVKPLHLDGKPGDGKIVSFQDVAFAYDEEQEPVFENVDAGIDANDRILLSGVNGAGKSTLCKLLLGEMEPSHGIISRTGNIIYFPQTALSDLLRNHGNETAIKYLEKDLTQTQARCHLGNFGLAKDLALREIHTLSAGQRVRLWLAKENLLHPSPCLLVFDEISENVDRETRDSLVKLLSEFEAAVLVISHDADFRGLFRPTKMWELRRFGLRETFAE
jgi:ATPase subunit of ABC transporter with duplicated ATPase domains